MHVDGAAFTVRTAGAHGFESDATLAEAEALGREAFAGCPQLSVWHRTPEVERWVALGFSRTQ